jgi:putative endonuclease
MREEQSGFVHIMASISKVIYIGSTTDLERRVHEHKNGLLGTFTKKYRCHRLVYFEELEDIEDARLRELELKKWRREKKINLINSQNPSWSDLSMKFFRS